MDRKRVVVLAAVFLLPLAGLEARLVHLQILSEGKYRAELHTRRRSLEIAAPPRGRILDRAGRVVAEDRRSFDAYLVLEEFERAPGAADRLASVLGIPLERVEAGLERLYRRIEEQMDRRPPGERIRILARERRSPYLLERDIGFEAALAMETGGNRYPGSIVREGLRRVYPCVREHAHAECVPAGAHLLGYVGKVNAAEYRRMLDDGTFTEGFEALIGEEALDRLKRKGVFLDELVGRDGAERAFHGVLRGKYGLLVFDREPGKVREMVELVPAVPGQDVHLTVDFALQAFIEEELAKISTDAAAVVLDPHSGEILVLASNRSFDPNDFVPPGNRARVEEYRADRGTLQSVAFEEQYPLGSVFKVVPASAGLENRAIASSSTIECRGKLRPDLRHYNCHIWNKTPGAMHGPLTLPGAMERSCNIFFFTLAETLGIDGLRYWSLQFGIGERTGLDLTGEAPGRLPNRDALSFSIGQADLQASPLQVAVAYSVVANGGKRVVPHVRRGGGGPPRETALGPATVSELRQALREVVFGEHGTAKGAGLRELHVAGKTGTAQSGRRNEAGEELVHAWFAGYAPLDSPRFVVTVFVKYGGHGGDVAAPIAAKIFRRLAEMK